MIEALGPELTVMAGGSVLGMASKFISAAQQAKAKQQELMLNMMKAKTEQADADSARATDAADGAAKRVGVDKWSPWARRIFVFAMLIMGAWAMTAGLSGLDIVVPVEKQVGFNFLGLIDTTKTVTEFVRLENAVVHFEWLKISILAAGSFYLGKS